MDNPQADHQHQEQESEFYSSIQEQFLDACRYNEQTLDELLAIQTLDITYANDQNNNCIHMASGNGHLQVLQKLFKQLQKREIKDKSKIIDKQNADGNTPLHYAVLAKNLELVNLLLKQGAKTGMKNDNNKTPFKEAVEFSTNEIAQALAKVTEIEPEDLDVEEIAEMEAGNQKIEEQDYEDITNRIGDLNIEEEECDEEEEEIIQK